MDQKKIGTFLKELRKEKKLTQEQFAEIFHVSNRSVSRWENGYHMPDFDILIEISDYYGVSLRELLDGERKCDKMEKDMEETVLKAIDYTNTETERIHRRVRICNAVAMLLLLFYWIVKDTDLYANMTIQNLADFAQGASLGLLTTGLVFSGKYGLKIKAFKQRLRNRV